MKNKALSLVIFIFDNFSFIIQFFIVYYKFLCSFSSIFYLGTVTYNNINSSVSGMQCSNTKHINTSQLPFNNVYREYSAQQTHAKGPLPLTIKHLKNLFILKLLSPLFIILLMIEFLTYNVLPLHPSAEWLLSFTIVYNLSRDLFFFLSLLTSSYQIKLSFCWKQRDKQEFLGRPCLSLSLFWNHFIVPCCGRAIKYIPISSRDNGSIYSCTFGESMEEGKFRICISWPIGPQLSIYLFESSLFLSSYCIWHLSKFLVSNYLLSVITCFVATENDHII